MTLQQLYYFQTIAKLQHYNRAATELNVSQPSLSKSMSNLEEELGVFLFEKKGRNVILSKYGKLFQTHVDTIIREKEKAEFEIKKLLSRTTGHIDIGYVTPLSRHYIPQTVRCFLSQDQNKQVTFTFTQGITAQMIQGLKEELYDVVFGSYTEEETDLSFLPILKEELVVIVPPHHTLASKVSIELEDLESHPFISYNHQSAMGKYTRKVFASHHLQMNFVCEASDEMAIFSLVAEGFGVSYVAKTEEIKEQVRRKKIRAIPVSNEAKYRIIYMIYDQTKHHIPAVSDFIEYIKEHSQC